MGIVRTADELPRRMWHGDARYYPPVPPLECGVSSQVFYVD